MFIVFIRWNKYSRYKMIGLGLVIFLIYTTCFFSIAENGVPPLIKRPEEDKGKQKTIIAEVVTIRTKESKLGNDNVNTENGSNVLEGNEALSFIIQKLGIRDYELVYKDKQTLSIQEKKELNYKVSEKLNYCLVPKEVIPPGIVMLDTRVQIEEGNKKVNAIQAVAKAKVGEPLVYKGIQLDNNDYIIILTLKSEDENQSQGGEQNQQEQKQEQEQQKENENNTEEQNNQKEQKDEKENKQENRQMQLLLESLDDMDQKEQKEMLNERERIMLPEKWW